ncbi:MAG: hypothetical protein AB7E72_05275 [Lysobacterales bacterium]
MLLAALSIFQRRPRIPLSAEDLAALDREGARSLNNAMVRSLRRTREQLWSVLFGLGFLTVGASTLKWSPSGLLAFVAVSAAMTVLMDALRWRRARRWVNHSHQREHRTWELLLLAWQVERGQSMRLAPISAPSERRTLLIAAACTLLGLPTAGLLLVAMGWTSLEQIWANRYLPLLTMGYLAWMLVRSLMDIHYVKGSTVGTRTLCLESEDALDVYALAAGFGLLMLPLGAAGAMALPFLIQLTRLVWRAWRYWWLRQALQLLSRRIYQRHPESLRASV